jgi:hypothetical protein
MVIVVVGRRLLTRIGFDYVLTSADLNVDDTAGG